VLMSASTVIVAINARLLRLSRSASADKSEQEGSTEPNPREDRKQVATKGGPP
jgi:hypothetical protein